MSAEARAVVIHLVKLIQESADVRYHVGGPHTRMRELLLQAVAAGGFVGDPLEALRPAPHRADEEPRVVRAERAVDRLEHGVEAIRRALAQGDAERAADLVRRIQDGESVD